MSRAASENRSDQQKIRVRLQGPELNLAPISFSTIFQEVEESVLRYQPGLRPTAVGLGEPSVTLIQNQGTFGLLVSDSLRENPIDSSIDLENNFYLLLGKKRFRFFDLDHISIRRSDSGIWTTELNSEKTLTLAQPSLRPYEILFIPRHLFVGLLRMRMEGAPIPIFKFAQKHFGRLPGFRHAGNSLRSPDDYATTSLPGQLLWRPALAEAIQSPSVQVQTSRG